MSLSTDPYKGVRDFYPEDYSIQEYIFSVMQKSAESFGYERYDASILEPAELYEAKTGEEIVGEQTYTFEDRGGRRVTLRPEMTPTVARMVASIRKSVAFPLRWYSIPNLFRYERPQKGRGREHWQLNVDMFGAEGLQSDVEIIELAYRIMRNFGFDDNQFEIRLNDRSAVEASLQAQGVEGEMQKSVQTLIDKKDKMPNFQQELEKMTGKEINLSFQESDHLQKIRTTLEERGISNARFEPTLMRGFDYYTGVVFEIFDTGGENNRSVFGGGRYDNLLDIFEAERTPAIGFGMGDMVIRDMLETYNLLPEPISNTQLALCAISQEAYNHTSTLANNLREAGINVYVDFSTRSVGDKISFADNKGIKYVTCVGEDEINTGIYTLKHLETGTETNCTTDELTHTILNS